MTTALGPFRQVDGRWQSYAPRSVAARAVTLALADVGYTEHGSNLQKFGERWSEDGVAWCGLAVATWWHDAGFEVPKALALQIDYVPALLTLAQRRELGLFIVGRNRVRRGDAVAFDFPNADGVADHVGLFIRWVDRKAGYFETVEGNTSIAGSQSHGGMVCRKVRHISEVANHGAGFVRHGRVRVA